MSFLEEAWTRAQPKLSAISRNISQSVAPRIIRVGQLDAELLDQELAQLLQEPLHKALSLIHTALKTKYEHELWLLIQLVLYKFSIWDAGASYGSKLQDLRYMITTPSKGSLSPSGLPRQTILVHGLLTILIPYIHGRIRTHALARAWPDVPSSDSRRRAWTVLTSLESTHALLALVNFVAFLWNGRHRTLADRLLGMRLVPSRKLVKRDTSYEFMNRQMVWHAFTEFLIFLLPLINARRIRRRINRLLSSTRARLNIFMSNATHKDGGPSHVSPDPTSNVASKRPKYWSLPRDQCAICVENASFNLNLSHSSSSQALLTPQWQLPSITSDQSHSEPTQHPVNVPYIASCGDIFCYHCITERILHASEDGDSRWECLRCGKPITSAERLSIDVEEVGSSDYDFTDEELQSTDLSGSMGSYFYSESDNEIHA